MKSREFIAWGAIIGMMVALFSISAVTRGPSLDAPGEATASVFGIVVDRVPIPATPDGAPKLPTDRILNGLLTTIIGTAIVSGCLGGTIGWGISLLRLRKSQ